MWCIGHVVAQRTWWVKGKTLYFFQSGLHASPSKNKIEDSGLQVLRQKLCTGALVVKTLSFNCYSPRFILCETKFFVTDPMCALINVGRSAQREQNNLHWFTIRCIFMARSNERSLDFRMAPLTVSRTSRHFERHTIIETLTGIIDVSNNHLFIKPSG